MINKLLMDQHTYNDFHDRFGQMAGLTPEAMQMLDVFAVLDPSEKHVYLIKNRINGKTQMSRSDYDTMLLEERVKRFDVRLEKAKLVAGIA